MKIKNFFKINPSGSSDLFEEYINYIDTSSVVEGKLISVQHLTDNYPSRAKRVIKKGDILYSTVRPNLKHYYHHDINIEHSVASTGFAILRNVNEEKADTKFVFYYLTLPYVVNYLDGIAQASQTTFPTFSYKDIGRIDLPNINVTIQRKIASILSKYDAAIENNNKRIALLEQMAQNLYKEWFVCFRFPGHENTKIENGIPYDWKILRMKDYCYVTDGTHDTPTPLDEGIPLITGKCITNGFIVFEHAYCISEQDHANIKKRSGLKNGDILFSNIGTVGNCCIVDYSREFSVKNVIIFKPKRMIDTAFLYYWMTSQPMQDIFSTQTNGASQQFVGLNFMRKFKILVPSEKILTMFANQVLPVIEQKQFLHNENENLTKQRDMLLPRLMSGKLEVKV